MRSSSKWALNSNSWSISAILAIAFLSTAGLSAPSRAQEGLEKDLGIARACADDLWKLCSDVLPDVGRIKSCVQNKMGQLSKPCLDSLLDAMAGSSFKVCKDQTYALCAAARCNVYDGVAYCQCDVKHGNSISLPFTMGKEDICSTNAAGANNKYMVSTYSLPESLTTPQGGRAMYTCPTDGSEGAYAQCDGGICFMSTEGTTFPGFDKPVPKGQIICSCPITTAKSSGSQGHQILGPYPCDKSFFNYCKNTTANTKTGSTIFVGAPTGSVQGLAAMLNGKAPPPLNECTP